MGNGIGEGDRFEFRDRDILQTTAAAWQQRSAVSHLLPLSFI
jgi:hypothetical protein